MRRFFEELKRRNVWRAGIAYLAGAWLLIEVSDTILPRFGFSDAAITNVIVLLAIGFVPALVISWFFELTLDGFRRDSGAVPEASTVLRTRKNFDRIIIVFLTLAIAVLAVDKFVFDPARDASDIEAATEQARTDALKESYGDMSIAVLAFSDMSPEGDQEYFADGIAEELLNTLTTIRELRVISRSTAFSFKGSNETLQEIGEKLDVSYILEGSVRKSGDKLRVTAQLIDARTDAHVWSDTYDRTLDDVFAIQDEISARIVDELKVTLLNGTKRATQIDTKAYDWFLKAQFIVNTNNIARIREAQALLDKVIEVEPDYIPALTALARVYYRAPKTEGLSREENDLEIRRLAERIAEIDPDSVDALGWQGWFAYLDGDWQEAAHFYEKALQADSSNFALLRVVVVFLTDLGKLDDAIKIGEHLQLRDPNCGTCASNLAYAYMSAGRFRDAAALVEDMFQWRAPAPGSYRELGRAWLFAGDAAKALAAFDKESLEDSRETGQIMALHDLGRMDEFEHRFTAMRKSAESDGNVALIYAWIGDSDNAFEWLDKALEKDAPGILDDNILYYSKIMSDPRWRELRKRYGYIDVPVESIEFDYSLSPGLASD
jgi:TolB-like protein/Flp pilus assembly protein TadD